MFKYLLRATPPRHVGNVLSIVRCWLSMSQKTQADKAAAAPKWSLLESAIWSPAKAGDKVEGFLGAPASGQYGEQHTLKDAEGGTVELPHLTVLEKLNRVPLGAMVRVTYKGEKVSKAGNTYKDFTIEVGEA